MVLHYLPAAVRRPLLTVVYAALVRSPILPSGGRAFRLVDRRLHADVRAGGRRRAVALRAVRRLDRHDSVSSALLVASLYRAVGQSDTAERRMLLVAECFPHASVVRCEMARRLADAGDVVGAHRELLKALEGDLTGLDVEVVLDLAVRIRSTEVISSIGRQLPVWPPPVENRATERVRQWSAVAEALDDHRRGNDREIAVSLSSRVARDAIRWALEERKSSLVRRVCQTTSINGLDRWTARHAAIALRRSGELTFSTTLAEHVLWLWPADRRMKHLVEVGRAGLRSMVEGWSPPTERIGAGDPRGQRSVAYLLHNSLPYASAGYATRTHGLLRALHRAGWDVHGVTRLGFPVDQWDRHDNRVVPELELVDGIPYHRLLDGRRVYDKEPIGPYIDDYTRRVERLVRANQLGIVHGASNFRNGFAAIGAGRRLGLPTVYEVRGLWELTRSSRNLGYEQSEHFALTARLEADACLHADHVLALTGALRELLIERGVPPAKVTVLPNGVDTVRFVPQPRDAELAQRLGATDKVVIGYVGSVLDYEGIDTLLHAVAAMSARRSDFHLLIVGDGQALADCQALSGALGLTDIVTFTGRVPHHDVERYYSLVDIAPFPRKPLAVCEAVSPLKPFEAMATGKVPVVSSVAALVEIVTDGENGLVFEKGSIQALRDALDRLVDDHHLRQQLSEAARDWVVRERDWGVLVRGLESVYADLTAGRPVRHTEAAAGTSR